MRSPFVPIVAVLLCACPKPDSVDMGQACNDHIECKAPADKCVTALGKKQCSRVCSKKDKCEDGFVCAKMDVTVLEAGEVAGENIGQRGYCLPKADVPRRAQTL